MNYFSYTLCCLAGIAMVFSGQAHGCVCKNYYETSRADVPKEQDDISDEYYQSVGSTLCTGVKENDQRAADGAARRSLSLLINSKVEVKESSTSTRTALGGNSESFKSDMKLGSSTVLEDSAIFVRWVKPDVCSVNSAVRINTGSVKKFYETLSKTRKNDQLTYFLNPGNNRRAGNIVRAGLIDVGFNLEESNADYTITVSINYLDHTEDVTEVILFVNIKPQTLNQDTWRRSKRGKSVNFHQFSKQKMLDKAVDDAMDKFIPELEHFLAQEVIVGD